MIWSYGEDFRVIIVCVILGHYRVFIVFTSVHFLGRCKFLHRWICWADARFWHWCFLHRFSGWPDVSFLIYFLYYQSAKDFLHRLTAGTDVISGQFFIYNISATWFLIYKNATVFFSRNNLHRLIKWTDVKDSENTFFSHYLYHCK